MESLAIEFSAVQVYSPASCRITSLRDSDPSGNCRILSFGWNSTPFILHVISGVGDPTAKQGNFASSLNVAVNMSSKLAILAGTLSFGIAVTLLEACPSPVDANKILILIFHTHYKLFRHTDIC